jgi:hypothetical protein
LSLVYVVLSCAGTGFVTGWSHAQGVLACQ